MHFSHGGPEGVDCICLGHVRQRQYLIWHHVTILNHLLKHESRMVNLHPAMSGESNIAVNKQALMDYRWYTSLGHAKLK